MSNQRPTIDPAVLAAIIEAAPGRVRNRLDKQPTVAESWDWKPSPAGFEIQAGEETVRIEAEGNVIRALDQVRCSCLLAPKCFHILACVSVLSTAAEAVPGARVPPAGHDAAETTVAETPLAQSRTVSTAMQRAALRVQEAVAGILCVGARAAGSLLQSALLRAGHECRVTDLPMLGNAALRIAEEVRRVRAQSDQADSTALRRDLVLALLACQWLTKRPMAPDWTLGTARREYQPLAVSRLYGWFAEPVLTGSGYAGICVHLLAPGGRAFQIPETRPGDAQWVWQAYNGGIDLGTLTVKGSDLCRRDLLVQNPAASADGRLGKGQSTRWAIQGDSSWKTGSVAERFARPVEEQLRAVFQAAAAPPDVRSAGWDLLAVRATVLGAHGPALFVAVEGLSRSWRLRIAQDDPSLAFRENLQLLARCPGLRLNCVGRARIESAGTLDALAIGPLADEYGAELADKPGDAMPLAPVPRLRLPDPWCGVCNLGLDRLQRHHIDNVSRWGVEVTFDGHSDPAIDRDGLSAIDRRLTAVALGGHRALPAIDSAAHRRDSAALRRRSQSSAADLLDALAAARSVLSLQDSTTGARRPHHAAAFEAAYLAAAVYLETARLEYWRQDWDDSGRLLPEGSCSSHPPL